MCVAGDHIMNDIMGAEPDEEGKLSCSLEMKKEGFKTEATMVRYKGKIYYRGLGFYPEINRIFIKSIVRLLRKFEF